MKTLYFECNMGAAGDMLTAALLELLPNKDEFVEKLNALGIHGIKYEAVKTEKCGITGTHMNVTYNGEAEHEHHHEHEHDHHHHSGMHEIEHIVSHLNVSKKVRTDILAVYDLIAQAESTVHGRPVTEIHFHEVGTMDAIADVTAVCMLIEAIAPDKIEASPIHVGSGSVKCAHGILPVPAPATERLLRGIPIYGGAVKGELCTPTGAAILRHFVTHFGDMPVMSVEKTGCGMGQKDFEAANCVRAMLGEQQGSRDSIVELCCNLDDMTPEALGFAQERIFEAGAADVFTAPIYMKKSRPAVLLTCLCAQEKKDSVVSAIFKYTTTIGIRETLCERYVLDRKEQTVATKYGDIRVKYSSGHGVNRAKPEYDDVAAAAKAAGVSIGEIVKEIK
ncbi:MAG: nickel pincer cofactor biosynthesis protein LarC [Clostridia bacterium]|jgi:pyridinium-3,5-bisthiocarboxylic acid mononucleotide nickel chelatase|nr:nickel pincer cofactor biosynthesis protein LarC [Clostridia bacterium]